MSSPSRCTTTISGKCPWASGCNLVSALNPEYYVSYEHFDAYEDGKSQLDWMVFRAAGDYTVATPLDKVSYVIVF